MLLHNCFGRLFHLVVLVPKIMSNFFLLLTNLTKYKIDKFEPTHREIWFTKDIWQKTLETFYFTQYIVTFLGTIIVRDNIHLHIFLFSMIFISLLFSSSLLFYTIAFSCSKYYQKGLNYIQVYMGILRINIECPEIGRLWH